MSRRWLAGFAMLLLVVAVSAGVMAQEVNKIKFFHAMSGSRIPVIERLASDFNDTHPGIEVTAVFNGSYRDNLQATITATAAGDTQNIPNVAQIFEVGTQNVLDSGAFAAAEDVINQCGTTFDKSSLIDAVSSYYQYASGKLLSFPWNSSTPILYFNKTAFDQAGATMPKEPTFQDIVDIGNKLKAAGLADIGAINWPNHSWFVEQWFAEQGQDLVDNGNGRNGRPSHLNFDSDAARALYTWWGNLVKDGLYTDPGFEAWDEANRLFIAQQNSMFITSTSDVTIITRDGFANGFEVGTAFLPVPDNAKRNGVAIGGASLWLPAKQGAQNLCDAATFASWLSQTAQTIRWHQQTGYFPVTKAAIDILKAEGSFADNPNLGTALDQLVATKVSTATQGAVMGSFLEVRSIIGHGFEALEADIKGGMDVGAAVEKALADMNTQADQAILDYQKSIGVK